MDELLKSDVIYQTRERVVDQDIQAPRNAVVETDFRGVWIPDETLFQVFDIASQAINNTLRNSKQKFANFTLIAIRNLNHCHGSNFVVSSL